MNVRTIAALALVAVVAVGAVAAAPGSAPVDVAGDDDGNAPAGNVPAGSQRGPPDDRGVNVSVRGPPADLPDRVPDFVSGIHETIGAFLSGDLDGSLGDALSGVVPEDGGEDPDAADGDAEGSDDSGGDDASDGDGSGEDGSESDGSDGEDDSGGDDSSGDSGGDA